MDSSAAKLRKLVPLKVVAILAIVALSVIALNLAGRDILQQSLGDISRASAEAKPLVEQSNPVMPWERELYEKYTEKQLTSPELGANLSKAWGISPREVDVVAWIARMKIYANFLDVFGFLLYLPGPLWFRVAWELYGEVALLIGAILIFASRRRNIHFRYSSVIAIAGIFVLSNLVSAPFRHSVLGGDIIRVAASWNFHEWYLRQSIVEWGEIPLWYRCRYSGAPYLGDPQMIVFYPSTILLALAPNEMVGIRYAILLNVIMSGIAMYFLMNVWKQKPEASLVAGVGYMLGGYTFAKIWAGHITFLYPNAWMPLVLAFLELSFRRRSIKHAALAGLSLAMQVQSGAIMALYTLILLAIYGLYKTAITIVRNVRKPRELLSRAGEAIKLLAIFAIFTSLISASKILPTLEVLPYIDRGAPLMETEQLKGAIPNLSYLIQAFTFRPDPRSEDLNLSWPAERLPYFWSEYWCYLGVLLPLAIISLRFVRRNGLVIPLVAAIVLSSLWSMGILYKPLLQTIPFFSFTRVPSRLLILAQFATPALVAIGVTNVQDWLANKFDDNHKPQTRRKLKTSKVVALLVAAIVFADLASASIGWVRTTDVNPTATPAMKQIMQYSEEDLFRVYTLNPPNVYTFSVNGLETTTLSASPTLGYFSWEFSINAYSRYHRLAQEQGSYKMMGMLNVKYVIADHPQETGDDLELIWSYNEWEFLYSNRHYTQRIEYVKHGLLVICPDENRWESVSIQTILSQAFNPHSLAIFHGKYLDDFTLDDLKRFSVIQIAQESGVPAHDPSKVDELLNKYASGGGIVIQTVDPVPDSVLESVRSRSQTSQINIIRYTPNSLEASVMVTDRGFALISETYIPGWRVQVDGREVKALRANDIFIGVPLDPGTHSLKIEFKPQNYDLGLASTLIGLAGVAVLLLTRQTRAALTKLPGYGRRRENAV